MFRMPNNCHNWGTTAKVHSAVIKWSVIETDFAKISVDHVNILYEHLGMRKLLVWWMPRLLMVNHNWAQMNFPRSVWTCLNTIQMSFFGITLCWWKTLIHQGQSNSPNSGWKCSKEDERCSISGKSHGHLFFVMSRTVWEKAKRSMKAIMKLCWNNWRVQLRLNVHIHTHIFSCSKFHELCFKLLPCGQYLPDLAPSVCILQIVLCDETVDQTTESSCTIMFMHWKPVKWIMRIKLTFSITDVKHWQEMN